MKYKGHISAAELIAKLRNDADHQHREAEKDHVREERQKAHECLFEPYLTELHSHGLDGDSLEDIVRAHSPLPEYAVDVLLASLDAISEPRLLESIVRALGVSERPFDGRPLARCFDSSDDEALRWAVINTIALTRPYSIDGWLSRLRDSPYWDTALHNLGV